MSTTKQTKSELREAFNERMTFYQSQHKTLGCRITHMIGVPMLVLSFPVALFNRRLAGQLQAVGWTLQLIGHYVFEHNSPVFLKAADPMTGAVSLVFVANEWERALKIEANQISRPFLLEDNS